MSSFKTDEQKIPNKNQASNPITTKKSIVTIVEMTSKILSLMGVSSSVGVDQANWVGPLVASAGN